MGEELRERQRREERKGRSFIPADLEEVELRVSEGGCAGNGVPELDEWRD